MIDVAAAVIFDAAGRLLICQRGPNTSCPLLWEFPGGKREAGEAWADCLIRECREELAIEIAVGEELGRTSYAYPERVVHLRFLRATIVDGEAQSLEHQQIRWVQPGCLGEYPFCPADEEIVARLQRQYGKGAMI